MDRLIIIGASGHGKVVADIAKLMGYTDIKFLDDDENKKTCGEYPTIGKCADIPDQGEVFVAVGNAETRKRLMEQFADRKQPFLIHPCAVIAADVEIGKGSVVMAGAVVNPGTKIGQGVIVNTTSSIDHDCVIGDYVHVSVGAHLCGTVKVGKEVWIGAGTIVNNNISICSNVILGSGTVVVKDIREKGTYIGIPARIMRKKI